MKPADRQLFESPLRVILKIVMLAFAAELLIMLLMADVHPPADYSASGLMWFVLDPALLAGVLGLILYVGVFKPIKMQHAQARSILDTLSEGVALNEAVMNERGEMIDYRVLEINRSFPEVADFVRGSSVVGERATKLYGMSSEMITEFWRSHKDSTEPLVSEMTSPINNRSFSVTASPFFDGKFVTSFRDITEHKRLEVALIQRKQELESLTRSIEMLREEDRRRIARELHDDLGHRLTTLRIDLDRLETRMPSGDSEARARVSAIVDEVDGIVDSVRRISEDLRPGMLDALGLVPALEAHASEFSGRTGIACTVEASGTEFRVRDDISISLFRIVQEALNNARKHSGATKIRVELSFAGKEVLLTVQDDGKGFPETKKGGRQGFGLLGMRERVSNMNGRISVTGAPGRGVRIEASIPTGDSIATAISGSRPAALPVR